MMVGFKVWYADGRRYAIRTLGRDRREVQADVDALPSAGLQVAMLYHDEHSTVSCPNGHASPFLATSAGSGSTRRACPECGAGIDQPAIRYRKIVQGNDHYFVAFDDRSRPETRDWFVGQTDKLSDIDRYHGAKRIDGLFISDAAYTAYVNEAMADFDVSALGQSPVAGTTDR